MAQRIPNYDLFPGTEFSCYQITVASDYSVTQSRIAGVGRVSVRLQSTGRLVVTGTQKGDLLGIPASGRPVRWDAIDVYKLRDGRISEEWAGEDFTAILNDTGTYKAPWIP